MLIYENGYKSDLPNYRPVNLMYTEYKILAIIIANRLQRIIDQLISKHQLAYIKERFIGTHARNFLDVFEYCSYNNHDRILLFLDFQKAFDSVDLNFTFKTPKQFNFGNEFHRLISIIYKDSLIKLKSTGGSEEYAI